jgi:hypothetical protein
MLLEFSEVCERFLTCCNRTIDAIIMGRLLMAVKILLRIKEGITAFTVYFATVGLQYNNTNSCIVRAGFTVTIAVAQNDNFLFFLYDFNITVRTFRIRNLGCLWILNGFNNEFISCVIFKQLLAITFPIFFNLKKILYKDFIENV